jgi:hypothetical protein
LPLNLNSYKTELRAQRVRRRFHLNNFLAPASPFSIWHGQGNDALVETSESDNRFMNVDTDILWVRRSTNRAGAAASDLFVQCEKKTNSSPARMRVINGNG